MQTISLNKRVRVHRCRQIDQRLRWLETVDGRKQENTDGSQTWPTRHTTTRTRALCFMPYSKRHKTRCRLNGRWTHSASRKIHTASQCRSAHDQQSMAVVSYWPKLCTCLSLAQLKVEHFQRSARGNTDWFSDWSMHSSSSFPQVQHTPVCQRRGPMK